jgi:hypothetical protein
VPAAVPTAAVRRTSIAVTVAAEIRPVSAGISARVAVTGSVGTSPGSGREEADHEDQRDAEGESEDEGMIHSRFPFFFLSLFIFFW